MITPQSKKKQIIGDGSYCALPGSCVIKRILGTVLIAPGQVRA